VKVSENGTEAVISSGHAGLARPMLENSLGATATGQKTEAKNQNSLCHDL
jgi:hypothetical protein